MQLMSNKRCNIGDGFSIKEFACSAKKHFLKVNKFQKNPNRSKNGSDARKTNDFFYTECRNIKDSKGSQLDETNVQFSNIRCPSNINIVAACNSLEQRVYQRFLKKKPKFY